MIDAATSSGSNTFAPAQDDQPGGIARIRRNLLDLGLWQDSIMERVEILPGNLSRKRFGLSPDAFDELAARVQVIVHAGATVNLVYPYATLRNANVGGTKEILRLACRGGATVQYVSTNGVLPPSQEGWPEDTMLDVDSVPTKLLDGYGQTKWVAEQLVLEAGRRGLPVRIHRAGTISGHSITGAANAWDLLSALIVESIQIGHAPDVKGWRAEMH
jgi:thioester reductase-like protein